MTPRSSTHDAVVERILAHAPPAGALWPPRVRLAGWIALASGTIALAASVGLRDDLAAAVTRWTYLLELLVMVLSTTAAAALALRSAVPGRAPMLSPPQALVVVAFAIALLAWLEPATGGEHSLMVGARCAGCIVAFGALPGLLLFIGLRRGAPFESVPAAAYAGAAVFLLALVSVRVACPIDDRSHLLAWHVLPAIAAACAFTGLTARRLDPLARLDALR